MEVRRYEGESGGRPAWGEWETRNGEAYEDEFSNRSKHPSSCYFRRRLVALPWQDAGTRRKQRGRMEDGAKGREWVSKE